MLKKFMIFLCIILLTASGLYFYVRKDRNNDDDGQIKPNQPLHSIDDSEKTKFKAFTAQEFSDLYNGFAYPNTQPITNDFSVTGNLEADQVIFELAESAGYKVRSAPVSDNFVNIEDQQVLQRLAADSWKDLTKETVKNGIKLRVTQGYRSAEDQNKIFTGRLGDISPASIVGGSADNKIREILKTTAPPGYSRHHTGYTVDLACESDPGVRFENSECFDWIANDNYISIKKFGWIPSYPEGIKNQGPDPESWEYIWVGLDAVKE